MKYNIKPHITEKSYRYADSSTSSPRYTFKVDPKLRKEEVVKYIEKTYKVSVEKVKSISIPGKMRRFKGVIGKTADIKKIIVQLKNGQKISDFEIDTKDSNNKPEKDNK